MPIGRVATAYISETDSGKKNQMHLQRKVTDYQFCIPYLFRFFKCFISLLQETLKLNLHGLETCLGYK